MVLNAQHPEDAVLTPTLLATVRFLLASAVFLPVLWRHHARVPSLRLADLPAFFLIGQLGFSIYFWLQYTGVSLTNAGVASVLVVGLIPLATMVSSALMLRERMGARKIAALALGAAGVAVVASQRGLDLAAEGSFLLGTLCLIANAFCFAVYSSVVRGLRDRYSPLITTGATMMAGTLGLASLSLFFDDWSSLGRLSASQWEAILYLGLVCSAAGYFCYNRALTSIEASRAASWIYLEPVVAVIAAAWLLGEMVTEPTVVGGLVIVGSLYFAERGR